MLLHLLLVTARSSAPSAFSPASVAGLVASPGAGWRPLSPRVVTVQGSRVWGECA